MSKSLNQYFEEYADYHRHPMNRWTHKIAIPFIVFHIVAMLEWVVLIPGSGAFFPITLAHVAYVAVIAWYVTLSPRYAVIMAVAYALCFPLGMLTPKWVVMAIAVIAWVIQLAGHAIWEKRSPAFVTNLLQALIGPIFFVAILMGDWKGQTGTKA